MRGRHPGVDNRELRAVLPYELEQVQRLVALAHDLEAGTLEQAGEALAQQHIVVGNHDTRGVSGVAIAAIIE